MVAQETQEEPSTVADGSSERLIFALCFVDGRALKMKPDQESKYREHLINWLTMKRIRMVTGSEISAELVRLKKESFKECYDFSCVVPLGQALSANRGMTAVILKTKSGCSVIGTTYDLRTETTDESAESENFECTDDGLLRAFKQLASNLAAKYQVGIREDTSNNATQQVTTDRGSSTVSRSQIDYGEKIKNDLTDDQGALYIESVPTGASIKINGKPYGDAPKQLPFAVGRYVIVVELGDYYYPKREEVQLGPEVINLRLNLAPAFGELEVKGKPDDSEVYIDGKMVGVTPFTNPKMKSGKYQIEVRKGLYKAQTKTVEVKDGQKAQASFDLLPEFGHLSVSTTPGGAEVSFDGKEKGLTPQTIRNYPSGSYQLRVTKKYFAPVSKVVVIGEGKTLTENFNLLPDSGVLRVETVPPGAFVVLDNDESTACKSPCTINPVTTGLHNLTATLDGYGVGVGQVSVMNGKGSKTTIELQAKSGKLTLMSEYQDGSPCRGVVFIDGVKQLKLTPEKYDLLATSHSIEVQCDGGKATETISVEHNKVLARTLRICRPDCSGKSCGSDGCAGECGRCSGTFRCANGLCVLPVVTPAPRNSNQSSDVFISGVTASGQPCQGTLYIDDRRAGRVPYKGLLTDGFHVFKVRCQGGEGSASARVVQGEPMILDVRVGGTRDVGRTSRETPAPVDRARSVHSGVSDSQPASDQPKPKKVQLLLETDFIGFTYYFSNIDKMALTLGPLEVGGRFFNRLRLTAYFDATILFNDAAPKESTSGSGRSAIGGGAKIGVEIVRTPKYGLALDGKVGFEYNTDRCTEWNDAGECSAYSGVSSGFVTGANLRFKFASMFQISANVDYSTALGTSLGIRVGMYFY